MTSPEDIKEKLSHALEEFFKENEGTIWSRENIETDLPLTEQIINDIIKTRRSIMTLGKVYLASGWFSPEWLQEVENIKSVFDKHGVTYFSPKDENLCDEDASTSFQDQVFEGNVNGMNEADWMLCNTRNKDMGTLFEAGYFHALGKPIVYFCDGLPPGAQFNLMLAASGIKVCTSLSELDDYIGTSLSEGGLIVERYQGKIE